MMVYEATTTYIHLGNFRDLPLKSTLSHDYMPTLRNGGYILSLVMNSAEARLYPRADNRVLPMTKRATKLELWISSAFASREVDGFRTRRRTENI